MVQKIWIIYSKILTAISMCVYAMYVCMCKLSNKLVLRRLLETHTLFVFFLDICENWLHRRIWRPFVLRMAGWYCRNALALGILALYCIKWIPARDPIPGDIYKIFLATCWRMTDKSIRKGYGKHFLLKEIRKILRLQYEKHVVCIRFIDLIQSLLTNSRTTIAPKLCATMATLSGFAGIMMCSKT